MVLFLQVILAGILSTCYAARLDNTYLPPGGAAGAGGSGLPAPFPGRPGGGIYYIVIYFI